MRRSVGISRDGVWAAAGEPMPAALVEQGTTRNQRVHIGTVGTLPALVAASGVRAPTLTIIGEVVKLHDKLDWFQPAEHVYETEFSTAAKRHT